MSAFRATYSPDDNKLRLYAEDRLDPDTYRRVKAGGFTWAPQQRLFVAPQWTPAREDLLIDLCGDIGDEDTTLSERAEARAERFKDYAESRASEVVGTPHIAAVRLWDSSSYWERRASAALAHARHKHVPEVRARRIARLEADQRSRQRERERCAQLLDWWRDDSLSLEVATKLADHHHGRFVFPLAEYPRNPPIDQSETEMSLWRALDAGIITVDQARELATPAYEYAINWAGRWIAHYSNRLTYERAMLAAQGGTVADRCPPEAGGACRCLWAPRDGWATIVKVNTRTVSVLHNYGNGGRNFKQNVPLDKLFAVMSKAGVDAARAAGRVTDTADGCGFYLAPPRDDQGAEVDGPPAVAMRAAA